MLPAQTINDSILDIPSFRSAGTESIVIKNNKKAINSTGVTAEGDALPQRAPLGCAPVSTKSETDATACKQMKD